ncbi:uncharacterized protein LOC125473294 [Pyrus x bretschneideri]|uniref:uncharacterized protein LOC125473294 n=1 Tax=Pyrus x bretschneideri TaxID=225117 RepID=UPI000510BA4A|nr:uncharacterized protein LOC125473294 [Pyrus x bretschneideri]
MKHLKQKKGMVAHLAIALRIHKLFNPNLSPFTSDVGAVVEGTEMVVANHVGVATAVVVDAGVVVVEKGGRSLWRSRLMNSTRNSIAITQITCRVSSKLELWNFACWYQSVFELW